MTKAYEEIAILEPKGEILRLIDKYNLNTLRGQKKDLEQELEFQENVTERKRKEKKKEAGKTTKEEGERKTKMLKSSDT